MSCARCEVRPVLSTPTLAVTYKTPADIPVLQDPQVPMVVYCPEGEPSWNPKDFGAPQLCLSCGVLYCPRIVTPKE